MKRTGKLTSLFLFILMLTLCVGMLASCSLSDMGGTIGLNVGKVVTSTESGTSASYVTGVEIVDGSIVVTYSDGTTEMIGSSVTNVNNNTITIDGSLTESGTLAASRALLSTVSVECGFTMTYYVQGGWFGGGYSTTQDYTSCGSGVIYTIDKEAGDAYIITNFHVVYDSSSDTSDGISDKITVSLWGDLETDAIPATFVGGSAIYDIAVLQVKGSERIRSGAAEAATVANSDLVQVGQTAMAVGNPEAEGIAVTSGVVSVDSETITMTAVDGSTKVDFRVMRVDAPINSGNSGGGLYDGNGQLIGIVNAKVSSSSVENIGYAIPSNVAVAIAQNIIDYCADGSSQNVHRAIVGIQSPTVTNSRMIYDTETGLVRMEQTITVGGVTSGGLAEAAGVQAGDVLVSIQVGTRDALTITRQYQIIDEMLYARVGDTVTLGVERDGALQTVTMTITEACLQLY